MHEFWTIPTANMTYTRSQTYTDVVVDEHPGGLASSYHVQINGIVGKGIIRGVSPI